LDDVSFGQLGIERFGKCRSQLDGRQLKGPASQRMAVMIDRGLIRPRVQELAGGVSTCRYAV
jgi:hypothetical protein